MKIKPEQLSQHLQGSSLPIYLISGDEPLLSLEASDSIRKHLQTQDFSERDVFHLNSTFDWNEILQTSQSLSLFAEKKIIELRIGSQNIKADAGRLICQLLEKPKPDTCFIFIADRLTVAQKKSAWFKAIDKTGLIVEIWPLESHQLPAWIKTRARNLGLNLDAEAINLLSQRLEGNLLAAKQELEKLALLYPDQDLGADEIINSVRDSSRYDVFSLTEALLMGQAERCQKIISGLEQDGTEISIVLWAVSRELRTLYASQKLPNGLNFSQFCQQERVWGKRQNQLQQAGRRVGTDKTAQLLSRAGDIDLMIKGMKEGQPWLELSKLCWQFTKPTSTLLN